MILMPMMNITSISIPRKDLVFAKTFDNSPAAGGEAGSGFEGCLEHSKVSERWSDITDAFANEKAEAEARAAEMTKTRTRQSRRTWSPRAEQDSLCTDDFCREWSQLLEISCKPHSEDLRDVASRGQDASRHVFMYLPGLLGSKI